ncbi:MAG: PAS domain-containing sensor histidine kinase, partial [Gammaproteobacteria bacterium]|nr:PAS domain-containing sensor histidine kinase [Gammaproteobacteria bacterium]
TNILSNATKFSPPGGLISVKMSETFNKTGGRLLRFSLHNEGPGIPECELVTVFDAFIQSSKTNTGTGGTGLGLAICKKIIEKHGGKIWAENHSQGGAIFTFDIPVDR